MAVGMIIFSIRLVPQRGGFCHDMVMKANYVSSSIILLPSGQRMTIRRLPAGPLSSVKNFIYHGDGKSLFPRHRASMYNFDSFYFIKEIVSI